MHVFVKAGTGHQAVVLAGRGSKTLFIKQSGTDGIVCRIHMPELCGFLPVFDPGRNDAPFHGHSIPVAVAIYADDGPFGIVETSFGWLVK